MSAPQKTFTTPLSEKMRPRSFDEFLGQKKILGPGQFLRESIEQDNFQSFILWGPPGSGKTSIANVIKKKTSGHMVRLAAVTSGVKDVRQVIKEAEVRRRSLDQKTVLFIDEIHRFNKAQQDAFLPFVEKGTIILIGATTENPYFEVISPLLSRARVYRLESMDDRNMFELIERTLADKERGLGDWNLEVAAEARELLVNASGGDARNALNTLQSAAVTRKPDKDGVIRISPQVILGILQNKQSIYDKKGEAHYNVISAFIKSIRGSDPDAAVYWLAKMLHNGEDPRFIARRLVISASEDVGLADPFALNIANAAKEAVLFVGMPEARIPLAEATVYLACAPKSNSAYLAIDKALESIRNRPDLKVPLHLCNPGTEGMKGFGYGQGYKYSHEYPGHFVAQQYLPDGIKDEKFYKPGELGHEKRIMERMKKWWPDKMEEK
ncbi:MAG: replication-associated recombination protein A [Vulcanimicrobiota bacterium]